MEKLALFGLDLFGNVIVPKPSGPVAERFTFPPFSVLDARSGEWQDRKRAWLVTGIEGEIGRGDDLTYTGAAANFDHYRVKEGVRETTDTQGTSIFDPVVCEMVYRWFCAEKGQVVDPFAGGSVRGIVAASLGLNYWGCDLRAEQIAANNQQAEDLAVDPRPEWVCGDSRDTLDDAPLADLLFTCPPYGDLEQYSEHPSDLSAMSWTAFVLAYRLIITRAAKRLKPNRFACFVVGNFRDSKSGIYRDLVGETVAAMREAGLGFYNDAVLITSVGSASMRVSRQFELGRKFVKTHQNVLIFIKGDWRQAVASVRA